MYLKYRLIYNEVVFIENSTFEKGLLFLNEILLQVNIQKMYPKHVYKALLNILFLTNNFELNFKDL